MAIEKSAARDTRKIAGIAVAGIVIVGGISYMAYSWLSTPALPPSHYDIDSAASRTRTRTASSPEYLAMMKEYDQRGADSARQHNDSFIAPLDTSTQPRVAATPQQPIALKTAPAGSQGGGSSNPTPPLPYGLSEAKRKAIDAELVALNTQWQPPAHGLSSSFGMPSGTTGSGQAGGEATSGAFSHWTESLQTVSASQVRQGGSGAFTPDTLLIPAATQAPAVVKTAVDSDNVNSKVIVTIPTGPYAGAVLLADSVRLAGDGVEIHLATMTRDKVTYNVDAYVQDAETLQSSIASHVSHRYVTRVLIPAIAGGLGRGGQMYEDSNFQVMAKEGGVIAGSAGTPSPTAVGGAILGGIASRAGQVLASDASRLPVTQVTVDKNVVTSVLFMKAVYASDNVRSHGAQTKEAAQQATPTTVAPPATPEPTSYSPTRPYGIWHTTGRGYPFHDESY